MFALAVQEVGQKVSLPICREGKTDQQQRTKTSENRVRYY